MWRQGDILIQGCERVPRGAVLRPDLLILAGAVTGHRHEVTRSPGAKLYAHGDDLFLVVVEKSATVAHPEHGPITLPAGTYRIWRQREFTSQSTSRFVVD